MVGDGQQLNTSLEEYNKFCNNLAEGCILYNIDSTNMWGDYFLVANISPVRIGEMKTYTALLLGLKKDKNRFLPVNRKIKLTPDCAGNVPFLKYVGRCKFSIIPELSEVEVNIGLATVYGQTDLRKFTEKLSIRKPKKKKYGRDGKLFVRKTGNK